MNRKTAIIKGTFLLTFIGIITKIIGFYYRIFLNKEIGAEGLGIYQLIFPVFIMCFSFCCVGIQTSLSRIVATYHNNPDVAAKVLYIALFSSCFLAVIMMGICYFNSAFIAKNIIKDVSCDLLIKILSFSFVPASIHSCISGYYYGLKKTFIPSISQIFEQIIRVVGVYLIFEIIDKNAIALTKTERISIAVWGLFIGEAASATISVTAFLGEQIAHRKNKKRKSLSFKNAFINLFSQAIPLTMNRLCTNFLQSFEAIIFPIALCNSGCTKEEALIIFGIFSGMALPLIMFPSALTNSLSVLLVSDVAESYGDDNNSQIARTIEYTIYFTLFLGIFCNGYFLENGKEIGIFLFNSEVAGEYISLLSFVCPFYYLSSTLGSILHGLGKTMEFFVFNIITMGMRLFFLWTLVPVFGINSFFFIFLISQIIFNILILTCLYKTVPYEYNMIKWLISPIKCCFMSYILITVFSLIIKKADINIPALYFVFKSIIFCIPFMLTSKKEYYLLKFGKNQ